MTSHRIPLTAGPRPSGSGSRALRRAALLGSLVLFPVTQVHASFTVPDAVVWGSVAINGSAAPDGTIVSGRVNDIELAAHVLGSDSDAPQLYSLRVPMSQPESFFDTPLPGTAFSGDSVQLLVAGRFVRELVLQAGTLTRADLNDSGSPPATFTATPPRPTPTITATRTRVPATRTRTTGPSRTRTAVGGTATPTRVVTGSPTATGATPTPTETPTPTPSPTPPVPCADDCDGDGRVDVSEAIRAVNIALGLADIEICRAADPSNDGLVTIDELILAVRNLFDGCP